MDDIGLVARINAWWMFNDSQKFLVEVFFRGLDSVFASQKSSLENAKSGEGVEPGFGESHWSGCGLWLSYCNFGGIRVITI